MKETQEKAQSIRILRIAANWRLRKQDFRNLLESSPERPGTTFQSRKTRVHERDRESK